VENLARKSGGPNLLQLVDERLERRKLLLTNELKFINKVIKVLEALIQMLLSASLGDVFEVIVVDVSVNTEHASQNLLHGWYELFSKVSIRGKDALVVNLSSDPFEEFFYVCRRIQRVSFSSCFISP
jgi:hypothetical protein